MSDYYKKYKKYKRKYRLEGGADGDGNGDGSAPGEEEARVAEQLQGFEMKSKPYEGGKCPYCGEKVPRGVDQLNKHVRMCKTLRDRSTVVTPEE
jgi:hypothetical protein